MRRAQVLLDRQRVIGAAFHGGVIAHDHAFAALDAADARDDAGAGRIAIIHAVGGQRADLEEGAAGVDEALDALAGQQLAALCVAGKARPGNVETRFQYRHGASLMGQRPA